jgi:hypothetical protein
MGDTTVIKINTTAVVVACLSLLGIAVTWGSVLKTQQTLAESIGELRGRVSEVDKEARILRSDVSVIQGRLGIRNAAALQSNTAGQTANNGTYPADELP